MINLNLGCNFSNEHVWTILNLKEFEKEQDNDIMLESIYGSAPCINPFGSARPRRREEELPEKTVIKNIEILREYNIKIYLTLNSIVPNEHGHRKDMFGYSFIEWVNNFAVNYVDALIVAHPGVIDLLHKHTDIPIIVSTVMNVHSLAQIQFIKNHWPNVFRICPALWRNRDITWLAQANRIIPLELLANEFCTLGGVECEGLYRQTCYINHSIDGNDWNPMDICTTTRKDAPWSWLQAKFILPQWIKTYREKTGINNFKVTGRTHGATFVDYIGKSYLSGKATGNLVSLWGCLESTYQNIENQEELQKQTLNTKYPSIPISYIEDKIPFDEKNCYSDNCNYVCMYCKNLFEKGINEKQIIAR